MDNKFICAYLWQDIIRLGFSPASTKEKKNWLLQYGRSLKQFWEVEAYPEAPKSSKGILSSTINSPDHLGLCFEYAIQSNDKFTVTLMYSPPVKDKELMWCHDMDGQYFYFPNQLFLTDHNKRSFAIKQMSDIDIGKVVDSLLIHPTPHQHIESPVDDHNIRIGGGLLNPFLYLFHLRVQLCPIQVRRNAERERLVYLFKDAIQNNNPVNINELMEIPQV